MKGMKMLVFLLLTVLSFESFGQETGHFINRTTTGMARYKVINNDSTGTAGYIAVNGPDTLYLRLSNDSSELETSNVIILSRQAANHYSLAKVDTGSVLLFNRFDNSGDTTVAGILDGASLLGLLALALVSS